jgi:putative MATE family efflux protein
VYLNDGRSEPLDRAAIRKQIIHLAWPVILEQILTTLAGMVDAALAGHLDRVAMAAIGFTQMPHWLLVGLFTGMGVGVNALVARFHGAGEEEQIEPATRAGFWLGLLGSLLTCLITFYYAPSFMRLVGAEPEVVPVAATLLRWLVPGMVGAYWMMVMTAALRATGDTRTSLVINVGINLLNAPLAYALIYGRFGAPALGIVGAGIATTASRLLGAVALLFILLGREQGARLDWRRLHRMEWGLMLRMFRIGSVSATERMSSTGFYLAYAYLIALLGTTAVAAQNITVAAENLSWYLSSGFAMATAAMVGQRLGAGRPDEAEQVVREAARIAGLLLGLLGLCFILAPGPYLALFTDDPAVREMGAACLRIAGLTEVATALALTLNGALSGAGETRPLFLITLAGGVLRVAMAALFVLGLGWGLAGAWVAASLDWIVRAGLTYRRFKSGRWQTVQV